MKVLFCSLKYEYGRVNAGFSVIEYQTFFETLRHMTGVEAEFFGIDERLAVVGRETMNRELIARVKDWQPDLLFCMLFTDEILPETINYITRSTATKTFNWFTDDHWRLPVYSRFWAPLFTMVGTTDSQAPEKYRRLGITNVIKTQWGANTLVYKPQDKRRNNNAYNITFVGAKYGNRASYIDYLKSLQLPAEAYGSNWPAGRVSLERMLEIFSFSKINLGFTESPYTTFQGKMRQWAKFVLKKESGRYMLNLRSPVSSFKSLIGTQRRQIKGRTFEVPACGGFLMTAEADNIGDYYIPGKEIVVYKNKEDLARQCKYYLERPDECQTIARAGYERTMRDHTYEKRFNEIFEYMELKVN